MTSLLATSLRTKAKTMNPNLSLRARYARTGQAGLTLIEIMLVLVILAIVMATLGSRLVGAGDKAKLRLSKLSMTRLKSDIEQFQLEHNKLPQSLRDLVQCTANTGTGCVPITNEESLKDAWGKEFGYSVQGNRGYEIKCGGPDGQIGGGDDLSIKGP